MAPNNRAPNSNQDIEKFSQSLEKVIATVQQPSFSNIFDKEYRGRKEIILQQIEEIDKPILRGLAMDVITVLTNWFEDPETVCCLIQGLWAIFARTNPDTDFSVGLNETEWAKWLDLLIAFVDFILALLQDNVHQFVFFIPDIFKEIMDGVIGAILMIMQEVLYALKEGLLNSLMDALDSKAETDKIWAKCLPLQQLLAVLKRYIHDYGLFADLFAKIKGWTAGKFGGFRAQKDLPKLNADLEFLKWFRDLLLKLKHAALNFDLCVSYEYKAPLDDTSSAAGRRMPIGPGLPKQATPFTVDNPSQATKENFGIEYTNDGTILVDKEKARGGTIPLLSNSSIRNFLHDYMGYPYDRIDSTITGSLATDSIQGSNINSNRTSNINADCLDTPEPEAIIRWALGLRNRKK